MRRATRERIEDLESTVRSQEVMINQLQSYVFPDPLRIEATLKDGRWYARIIPSDAEIRRMYHPHGVINPEERFKLASAPTKAGLKRAVEAALKARYPVAVPRYKITHCEEL